MSAVGHYARLPEERLERSALLVAACDPPAAERLSHRPWSFYFAKDLGLMEVEQNNFFMQAQDKDFWRSLLRAKFISTEMIEGQ